MSAAGPSQGANYSPSGGRGQSVAATAASVGVHLAPATLGLGTLVVVGAALEALIRGGAINRYVMPLPSQVLLAFERIAVEENVVHRFLLTTAETLVAGALITIVGVALGVLLYRARLTRAACEKWVAVL